MNVFQCFIMAFKSLSTSKMRSLLTMLGIIIGVGAVIVIMALGNGMQVYMNDSFESMGTTQITVNISGRGSSRTVDENDMYELYSENSNLFNAMSPNVTANVQVRNEENELHTLAVMGVSEDYLDIKQYNLEKGRNIGYVDIENYSKVCVVGAYYDYMVYGGDSIGNTLKINGDRYTIIGVVEEQDDKTEENGMDDFIYVPYSTAAKYISKISAINSYTFLAKNEDLVDTGIDLIEQRLYRTYQNDDFYSVTSLTQILDIMNDMMDVLVTVLTAIAGISLLVGGIGIMNIMLVSVTERTREIGIRKALGAKGRHIRMQFVIEAATTSALGGLLGILTGTGISSLCTELFLKSLEISAIPTSSSIMMSFGISVAIGVLFGYLPANKAAKLNPIDALHHD